METERPEQGADRSREGLSSLARALAGRRPSAPPFIVGLTGAVATGKSTLAVALVKEIAAWDDHPSAETVSTDGFLLANAVLDARGLTLRKGYPESYDAAGLVSALVAARRGPVSFPGYSHAIYDVDPARTRRIDRPDVLLVEGLGLGAARSALDALVFIAAAEEALEAWYVARFLRLWEAGRSDPTSFYARFAALDRAGATALALSVWREINLPNLRENIAPLREVADIVVEQGPDHAIVAVRVAGDRPSIPEA